MKLEKDFHRFWLALIALTLFIASFACGFKFIPLVFADREAAPEPEIFITVLNGNEKTIVKSSAPTVRDLLARLDIIYEDYDAIEPSLETALSEDNFYVSISRARPVLLQHENQTRFIMSTAQTPREMFESLGLELYDDDQIITTEHDNVLEVGLATAYRLERGSAYHKAKAEAEAAEAAKKEAERLAAELAARPAIRPEWSGCAAWVRKAGVSEDDLAYALTLIYHESGCRVEAKNSRSGAYGIPQALPGNKMASMGEDWQTNPITQIRWMAQYVTGRYGGWKQALDFWNKKHWY